MMALTIKFGGLIMADKKMISSYDAVSEHRGTTNFVLPKGVVPGFSTKAMADLWLLQILKDNPVNEEGEVWYGKSLVKRIRQNTVIEGIYDGYQVSEGIVFGLISQWLDAGIVEGEEARVPGARRPAILIKITPLGVQYLEDLKKTHERNVKGAVLVMNRLYADLYGQGQARLLYPDAQTRYVGLQIDLPAPK
jgi:DNA-binding PadR family transcriptional regulator